MNGPPGGPGARLRGNLLLAGATFVLAILAAELVIRAAILPKGYFVTDPGTSWTIVRTTPGVTAQVARFHVNRFGIRGRLFGNDRTEYRILAIGGSTTECGGLDDSQAWPHLLETGLDTTIDGRRVWVGNVGHGGMTTRDHVLHVKYLLAQYPRIDLVVSLLGVNDVEAALSQVWDYRLPAAITEPGAASAQIRHAFVRAPGTAGAPWYKATAWWWLAQRAKQAWKRFRAAPTRDLMMSRLEPARRARREAGTSIDSLPPLEQPLLEYRRNLNAMVSSATAAGAQVVFVTQPSAWRERMTEAERHRLWFGWVGPHWQTARAYYTPGALSRAMAAYNQTVLDVCRERALTCVDAARLLPSDTTVFDDDVHFSERGSALLAEALVTALRQRAPFHGGTPAR